MGHLCELTICNFVVHIKHMFRWICDKYVYSIHQPSSRSNVLLYAQSWRNSQIPIEAIKRSTSLLLVRDNWLNSERNSNQDFGYVNCIAHNLIILKILSVHMCSFNTKYQGSEHRQIEWLQTEITEKCLYRVNHKLSSRLSWKIFVKCCTVKS